MRALIMRALVFGVSVIRALDFGNFHMSRFHHGPR